MLTNVPTIVTYSCKKLTLGPGPNVVNSLHAILKLISVALHGGRSMQWVGLCAKLFL